MKGHGHTEKKNPDERSIRKCIICGEPGSDRAHWTTRGKYPKNDRWNPKYWRYLCRTHHTEEGTMGEISFAHKYKMVKRLVMGGFPLWRLNSWRASRGLEELNY